MSIISRLCIERSWNTSRVMMALPYRQQGSDHHQPGVDIRGDDRYDWPAYSPLGASPTQSQLLQYTGPIKYHSISKWIASLMSNGVTELEGPHSVRKWVHEECSSEVGSVLTTSNICVLIVSSLTLPPMFISALSVRLTGKLSGCESFRQL